MNKKRDRLFLLDSMGIAYRSFYAFITNPLINSKGENTSAAFGFVNYLNKILDEQKPEYIAAVFDTDAPTFRHREFKEYKATRNKMPEELASSLSILKDIVRAFNVPVVELDGYEADDIIGTLAKRAEKENIDSYLVTSDKDLMQLVSSRIKLYRPGKFGNSDEIVDERDVMKKFGVAPEKVIEVLALTGDTSDNVPGVPGIGPKTASPLINKYHSIENLYEHLDSIPQKGVREKLQKNIDLAFLSKKLVTIDINTPVQVDIHSLKSSNPDYSLLLKLFEQLEFNNFISRIKNKFNEQSNIVTEPENTETDGTALASIENSEHTYIIINSDADYLQLLSRLRKAKAFVFDTETTSTNPFQAQLVGISFCMEPLTAYYLPVDETENESERHDLFTSSEKKNAVSGFSLERVIKDLQPIFKNQSIKKYGQNIKYDMLVLASKGITTAGIGFDTMIAAYVLRSDRQHSLDTLASEYLRYKMISFDELTEGKKKDIRELSLDAVGNYSAEDADITFQLVDMLYDKISAQGLKSICTDIEFPLVEVLAAMELNGISIDVKFLHKMSQELSNELDALIKKIYYEADEQFNINSTQQLAKILFEKLQLRTIKKTKTGFSTDVAVLEALRREHPIIPLLLEYRQLTKLKSTYVDALPKLMHPKTQRVHTSFNQTVAATGRLSSSDPNLQNIPIRTELGRKIRQAFIPGSAKSKILSADYSQIELRIMAHTCGDEGLLEAFRNKEDIHTTTAAKVFGISPKDVTREMRRKAKEINFGIMYGIGAFGLASRLDISQTEAKEIISKYFERFPKVNHYISETIAQAHTNGFVSTLLGRRRYLPEIDSKNANIRQNAERQAINMPIQGTAADMIKLAMIRIHTAIVENSLQSKMLLQVHDELVFEIPDKEEKKISTIVKEEMIHAMDLNVPIEVEIGIGSNWLEAH
ncbi:MAG: DNA polymerase I [Bacteroidetes bacterium]|nr:DNA polymerase I [Bacteroidota bacterium]